MRRAVIDIGSNTVKLFVADVTDGTVAPVALEDKATRLAEGAQESQQLAPQAIQRTANIVATYAKKARDLGASTIHAVATSAVRQASNQQEFLREIREQAGVEVEIITGDREAELIYWGVASEPELKSQPLTVIDVGGGSAEFIQGGGKKIERLESLPIGAVRMTEQFGPDRFAEMCEHLRRAIHPALRHYDPERTVVATGGTIITLARVNATQPTEKKIGKPGSLTRPVNDNGPASPINCMGEAHTHRNLNGVRMTDGELRALVLKLNAMSLEERLAVPGLPKDRADIIVAGGMVYVFALEALGAPELVVSTRNLRYGLMVSPGEEASRRA